MWAVQKYIIGVFITNDEIYWMCSGMFWTHIFYRKQIYAA